MMFRMKGLQHHLLILPAAPAPARRVYPGRLFPPKSRSKATAESLQPSGAFGPSQPALQGEAGEPRRGEWS